MPKIALFATTALVSATWLAAAAGPASAQPASNRAADVGSFPVKDANQAFLCNYGYDVTYSAIISSGSSVIGWSMNVAAVPIIGKGKVVNEIVVADSATSESRVPYGFYVELLQNDSRTDTPGQVIATSQPVIPKRTTCEKKTMPISSTLLNAGQKYWVEEIAYGGYVAGAAWLFDTNRRNKAISQSRTCYVGSGCDDQPWQAIPGAYEPYVGVR